MLEAETNDSSESHPSSSSASDVPVNENCGKAEGSNLKLLEAAYKSIFDELVEDVMWELCFEVHKAVKCDYFFLEDPEKRKHQIVEDAEKDIFGQALKSKVQTFQISCPICIKKSCATKFASHLAKCIGISGRNSSRAANKKIAAANLYSSDLDENEYDSDSSFNTNRKRSKKNQSKKNSRKKSKVQGHSFSKSSDINANYQEMTYEKRKAFFNQMCGVISKRTNKMCMNSHKCVMHSDEQRRDVRHILLRDMGDQLTNDGQIDVDTVDEGNARFSFITQQLPSSSATSKNITSAGMSKVSTTATKGLTGEKKQPTSKNSSSHFRKKKTSFSSSNAVSSPNQIMPAGSSFEPI